MSGLTHKQLRHPYGANMSDEEVTMRSNASKRGKKLQKILRSVWGNYGDMRYVPRHNGAGAHTWGVWDKRQETFIVMDDDIIGIDPLERMTTH